MNSPEANLEEPRLVLRRVVIEGLEPEVMAEDIPSNVRWENGGGRAAFTPMGDVLSAVVLYRPDRKVDEEAVMRPLENDRWRGQFS